jgi:hypothetical protein
MRSTAAMVDFESLSAGLKEASCRSSMLKYPRYFSLKSSFCAPSLQPNERRGGRGHSSSESLCLGGEGRVRRCLWNRQAAGVSSVIKQRARWEARRMVCGYVDIHEAWLS